MSNKEESPLVRISGGPNTNDLKVEVVVDPGTSDERAIAMTSVRRIEFDPLVPHELVVARLEVYCQLDEVLLRSADVKRTPKFEYAPAGSPWRDVRTDPPERGKAVIIAFIAEWDGKAYTDAGKSLDGVEFHREDGLDVKPYAWQPLPEAPPA